MVFNVSGTNTGDQTITLTGDVTGSGTGSFATTLATVNTNVGTFGSASVIPVITVNGKGLITAVTTSNVTYSAGSLTGTTLASNVVNSSLTSVGTLATGTWNASVINPTYGGTGVANASNITIGGAVTFSGAFGFTGTLTGTTSVTFPTTGTLVNSAVTTLSSLTSVGTIGTGTWQGTVISPIYGGTGVNNGSFTITATANATVNQNTSTAGSPSFVTASLTGAVLSQHPVTANSSTAYTIDQANGAQFDITLTANTTLTLQSVTAGKAQELSATLIQDGTGGWTAAFANVTWASGAAPAVPTAVAARTYLKFISDGATWTGYAVPQATGSGSVVLAGSPTITSPLLSGGFASTPTDSHTATALFGTSLTLGTAIQNLTGYDIIVNVGFAITVATTATIIMGVGSTSTPTTDTIIPSFSTTGTCSITAYVPNNYYLLVNKTGTLTSTNNIVVTPA